MPGFLFVPGTTACPEQFSVASLLLLHCYQALAKVYAITGCLQRMTWTLRFYDDNGTEVGWVRTEPYEYEITYPSDMPKLDETLTKLESPVIITQGEPWEDEDEDESGGILKAPELHEFVEMRDQPGHLEYIQDYVTRSRELIESGELNDE